MVSNLSLWVMENCSCEATKGMQEPLYPNWRLGFVSCYWKYYFQTIMLSVLFSCLLFRKFEILTITPFMSCYARKSTQKSILYQNTNSYFLWNWTLIITNVLKMNRTDLYLFNFFICEKLYVKVFLLAVPIFNMIKPRTTKKWIKECYKHKLSIASKTLAYKKSHGITLP